MEKRVPVELLLEPVAGRDLIEAIAAIGLIDPFKGAVENPPAESCAMMFQSAPALDFSPVARRMRVGFGVERQLKVGGRSLNHGSPPQLQNRFIDISMKSQ
jgi:hypothetical protein